MTPAAVAAEVLSVSMDGLSVERIKGGLTNESWCVQTAHAAVVVRISTVDEHALQLNRYNEARVLSLVQQADIGAEVLLCDPQRRLLVTRKLKAETLTLDSFRETATIDKLAALLRHLHALPVPTSVQQINLSAVLRGYWQSLAVQGEHTGDDPIRARAMNIALESQHATTRCLCHNDVHHLNLMSDHQRLWLLDWEYAGIGDPFFDLASVCCYHAYDATLRERLLIAYCGELRLSDSERLQRMCWLFDYIKELWLAVRQLSDSRRIALP